MKNDFVEFKKNTNSERKVYAKMYLNFDNEGNIVQRKQQPLSVIRAYSNIDSSKNLKKLFGGKNIFDYSKSVELLKKIF